MIILLLTAMLAGLHAANVLPTTAAPELDVGNNIINELSITVPPSFATKVPRRPLCPKKFECWTSWFDRDDPSGTGDWETLSSLRWEYPGSICPKPLEIEVQTIHGRSMLDTGNVIAVADTITGFICKNADQRRKRCEDYRVRFRCPTSYCCKESPLCWTRWFDRDNPSGTGDWEYLSNLRNEYKGAICDFPIRIEAVTVGTMVPADVTGQTYYKYDVTSGFVCLNKDQRNRKCMDYKVRFECPCQYNWPPHY